MKKVLLLAAAAVCLSASAQDYYIIGSDVNGKTWVTGAPDCKFENKGNGIYEWHGEKLGTGFKINNGTWDAGAPNFGSSGDKINMNEEYWYTDSGSSGNIDFNGFTAIVNPIVTLNTEEGTIILNGTPEGETEWFFVGNFDLDDNGNWAFTNKMTKVSDDLYEVKNVTLPETGEFKITTTGWGDQYGSPEEAPAEITPENLTAVLGIVGSSNACPFTLNPGSYDITWDLNNTTVTFAAAGTGVATLDSEENAPAVYYNLQGVRVNNPKNGIFVKVYGKNAVKVNIAK